MSSIPRGRLVPVEKARARCPICDKPDFCLVDPDGMKAICMRVAEGARKPVDMKGLGQGWLHVIGGPQSHQDRPHVPVIPRPEPADRDTLHRAYRAILDALRLSDGHRQALHARGLRDDERIDAIGLRSLPAKGRARVARAVLEALGGDLDQALRVPGLFLRRSDDKSPWLTIGGSPGLLIPSRDSSGRIFCLQVRRDEPGQGGCRYQFLTSADESRGNGPGPVQGAHVPLHRERSATVRLTEGPLKSEVATHLSGILTIAAPGVGAWRLLLPALKELAPARVLVAFDADFQTNPRVARELSNLVTALQEAA